jgi:hypothetical protein
MIGEVICHLYEGLDERHWGKTRDFMIPFQIIGDGKRAMHYLDVSSAPDSFIGFSLRFKNQGHIKIYSIKI